MYCGRPFAQLVADNADHNVKTIDGKNSVHLMAIICCVTPSSSVKSSSRIPRLSAPLSAEIIAEKGQLKLTQMPKKILSQQ